MNNVPNRNIMIIMFVVLSMILSACSDNTVVLHKTENEIVQVNLLYDAFGENELLYTLQDNEIASFVKTVSNIKLHKNLSPQDIGGSLIIEIVYSDNSCEILGDCSIGYLSNGTLEHDGWYYVSDDDLYDMFSVYIDISLLPTT